MLSTISWSQYISVMLLLLICYYGFVGYKYFRLEVLSLIGIRKVEDNKTAIPVTELKKQFTASIHSNYLPNEDLDADISPVVQAFTDEVKAFISNADANMPKPELLYSLQLIMSKYPALKNTDCKEELLQFVLTENNNKHPDILEPDDLRRLWQ